MFSEGYRFFPADFSHLPEHESHFCDFCARSFSSIILTVIKKDIPAVLRGWKAIAEYLSQPTSTAQRWARDGMPVRREGRNVVADRDELSAWLGRESHAPAPVTMVSSGADLIADLRRGVAAMRKKRVA